MLLITAFTFSVGIKSPYHFNLFVFRINAEEVLNSSHVAMKYNKPTQLLLSTIYSSYSFSVSSHAILIDVDSNFMPVIIKRKKKRKTILTLYFLNMKLLLLALKKVVIYHFC